MEREGTDGRGERGRKRGTIPVGWTRLASTTSDVATAQSPGLPSPSTFSPSRREIGDPPRHHPPHVACRPRTPHLFQGHGSIPTSVRASVRTSVRKLAATAVTPVCISAISQDAACTSAACMTGPRLIVRNACQIATSSRSRRKFHMDRSARDCTALNKSCPRIACGHYKSERSIRSVELIEICLL